jgi:OOP family OmpA-OmpF porin
MKKIFLILAIMLTLTSYGQFNRWALSAEYGNQMVDDKTAVNVDYFYHTGIGVRYNINDIFAVGVTGGYDNTALTESTNVNAYDFQYKRINAEGYINAFKLLGLHSRYATVLFHGGAGTSFMNGGGFKQTVTNIRGGGTLLVKVTKRLALTGDFSTTSNINQTMKFNGSGTSVNTGVNSNISNASVGLTFYLDNKKENHADWYVKPVVVPVVNNVTNVTENSYPLTENEFNVFIKKYNDTQPSSEFVFFLHDKCDIRETELNAIYKVYTLLDEHSDWKLSIKGFASPTSSSIEYNQTLSESRTNELLNKFVDMGIDKSRITIESYGKDTLRSNQNVHDVARRVELIVKRK